MRYDAIVRYKGEEMNIKVQQKSLSGTYDLPEFIKETRLAYGCTIQQVHMLLDWSTNDIMDYEEGVQDIPQDFLSAFARFFHLPQKIKHLVARLKQLRIEEEVPQIFIAADLGIARSTYACYESGKNDPDIYTLWKLADLYGVSLDKLVGRDFQEPEKSEQKQ